jgi:hypothetical protein
VNLAIVDTGTPAPPQAERQSRPAAAPPELRWAPTHADLLFAAIIAWCFLAGENGWARLLMDGDAGVHLRIGDWVRANGTVPSTDLFGFSKPHGEWIAYEWLAGVLFSWSHSWLGLKGMVLLAGALLALAATVAAIHAAWRGAAGVAVVLLSLLATNSQNIHFLARPHIFTLLLFSITVWLVERDRRRPTAEVLLLMPLMALWANLHGGFFIVFPYLGLLVLGSLAERRAGAWRYALLGIGGALATLANPYGWSLHAHILKYLNSPWVTRYVDEFKSPSFRSETMLCFMALLFLGLGAASLLLRRGRYTEVLWILFFSYCSLVSVRHTTIFMAAVVPIIAEEATGMWPDLARVGRLDMRRLSVWAAAFVVGLASWNGGSWPKQFPSDLFPVEMVERNRARLEAARVFSTDQWADYLIYRNYRPLEGLTRQQVFMDARHNYFGERIGNDFIRLIHGLPGWAELIEKYRLDAMLLPADSALTSLLSERPEWRQMDRDSRAVLFLRSQEDRAAPLPSGSLRPVSTPR